MSFMKYVLCTLMITFVLQSILCYENIIFELFWQKVIFYCKNEIVKKKLI